MLKIVRASLLVFILLSSVITADTQEKKLTTVNLGYAAISGSFAPLWVGFEQGLFTKHGIDLKMATSKATG
jgi:ABC-type nitrate/sulfonate/bicarbonate transport system substrate-binding protein